MQRLHQSLGECAVPSVQPLMPLVWREDAATDREAEHQQRGLLASAPCRAGGLAEPWPQRSRDPFTGAWAVMPWPGQDRGIRRPAAFETPLSWAEVMSPLREGAL